MMRGLTKESKHEISNQQKLSDLLVASCCFPHGDMLKAVSFQTKTRVGMGDIRCNWKSLQDQSNLSIYSTKDLCSLK